MSEANKPSAAAPTLAMHPLATLALFTKYMGSIMFASLKQFAFYPLTTYLVYPAIACYVVLKAMGLFPAFIHETEMWFSYSSWWLILGILSSIGLGSGLHSGVLFLFPHIFKVCLAVESCGHTAFDVRDDVWLRGNTLHCEPLSLPLGGHTAAWGSPTPREVTALDLFCKVVYTGMIWGVGTAIGEVPPYLFSYMMQSQQPPPSEVTTTDTQSEAYPQHSTHSMGSSPESPLSSSTSQAVGTNGHGHSNGGAKNGNGTTHTSPVHASHALRRSDQSPASPTDLKADSQAEEPDTLLMQTLEVGIGAQPGAGSEGGSIFSSVEQWLSKAVNKHGFVMVVSLASFPNPLFDMCGLACGRCRMPFGTFFSATLIGKGVVKVCIQIGVLVVLFQEKSREAILEKLQLWLPNRVPVLSPDIPFGQAVSASVHSGITQFQESVRHIASDQQQHLWRDLSLHSMADGAAWIRYAQSFVPRTFKEVWASTIGLIMLMFVWSFIDNLAQVQWKASQQQKRAKSV